MVTYRFGELLREYRNKMGLTQAELALKIGRGRNTVSNWERGINVPDRETVLMIGDELGLETEFTNWLLESAGYATITLEGKLVDPSIRDLKPEYTTAEKNAYLKFVQNECATLRLPDGEPVELERIYVSLKADAMNAAEREAEYRLMMDDVEALYELSLSAMSEDSYRRWLATWKTIARAPRMKMLEARDYEMLFGPRERVELSLAEVVQRHDFVVILGDPGCGKTTLCRWLTLQFARALSKGEANMVVAADRVRPGDEAEVMVDFGPVRLPILVSIGGYAKARFPASGEDNDLSLQQFIEAGRQHTAQKLENNGLSQALVGTLAKKYMARGQALIILDGLDEVGNPTERRLVMEAVEQFVQEQRAEGGSWRINGAGNKALLTSRIVGYRFKPLSHLAHYIVEEMDETAIKAFSHAWLSHVAQTKDVTQEAKQLQSAILDAHPGVRTLAGNPLLLTILAQVYWQRPNRDLPTRRVELFAEAEAVFFEQRRVLWETAGISQEVLKRALGVVAVDLHSHEVTGFAVEEDIKRALREALPNNLQVEAVLRAARDVSGLLVARGEGVYGFLHRALQEYFAARYLVETTTDVGEALRPYVLDPTWHEPVVLAVGIVSESRRAIRAVFEQILDVEDAAGAVLPRRELVAVAACSECLRIPSSVTRELVRRLLGFYANREGVVKTAAIRERIETAFATLRVGPAGSKVEEELCAGIISPVFEERLTVGFVVANVEWYTPAVVAALVKAWRMYAAPAGTMLVSLQSAFEHKHLWGLLWDMPGLEMRQAMVEDGELWERAEESSRWRAVIKALYLSPYSGFEIEAIHRESPLTEHVLACLREENKEIGLRKLEEILLPLTKNPESLLARDAALGLSALGNYEWIPAYAISVAGHTGGDGSELQRAPFSAIVCYIELWHSVGADSVYESGLASMLTGNSTINLAHALDLDIDLADDLVHYLACSHALNLPLSNYRDHDIDLGRDLACDLAGALVLARDLTLQGDDDAHDKIATAMQQAKQRWADKEAVKSLSKEHSEKYRDLINVKKTGLGKSDERWTLRDANLGKIVAGLESANDGKRERARETLLPRKEDKSPRYGLLELLFSQRSDEGYAASELGKEKIEELARLKQQYDSNYQVGTQLAWALAQLRFDEPKWVEEWVKAAVDCEKSPERDILSSMCRPNEVVLQSMLDLFAEANTAAQQALLQSLGWVARLRPGMLKDIGVTWLLACWEARENEEIVQAVIKLLGYWPAETQRILEALEKALAADDIPAGEKRQIYWALAEQARRKKDNREAILQLLQAHLREVEVRTAWIRAQVTLACDAAEKLSSDDYFRLESWESRNKRLTRERNERASQELYGVIRRKMDLAPDETLEALWLAGNDDDMWNAAYHEIIVQCGRLYMEDNAGLLTLLLRRYVEALNDSSWTERRILLAMLAACMETMPRTVENAAAEMGLDLEQLLIKGAFDPGSFNVRRFAISSLSYLRLVSEKIVPVLITALQENVEIVRQEAIEACRRFKKIDMRLVQELGPYLTGESVKTALGAAQMLGALGVVAGGEDSTLRLKIIGVLAAGLLDAGAQRKFDNGKEPNDTFYEVKKLEDVFYEQLFEVAGLSG